MAPTAFIPNSLQTSATLSQPMSNHQWIVKFIVERGRTELFKPIALGVYPTSISTATTDDITFKTGCTFTPDWYAQVIRQSLGLLQTTGARQNYVPPSLGDRVWLTLDEKPKDGEHSDTASEERFVLHLLDGQKRIMPLRHLQRTTTIPPRPFARPTSGST
ncbi:hypothetical protein V8E36_006262 [Tilletia maclaganii]